MTDPRLTCDHRRLGFESNSLRIHCQDCDQVWVTTRGPDDDRPDLTTSNRGNAPFIDVVALKVQALHAEERAAAMEKAGAEQAGRADQNAADLRVALKERDEWKAGVEDANRISQRERDRADKAEAQLALVGPVVEAARWFSAFVYPPGTWKPDECPGGPDNAETWAKRLNARLAALEGE